MGECDNPGSDDIKMLTNAKYLKGLFNLKAGEGAEGKSSCILF